jgi:preprotein translocase subunit SecG
MTWPDFVAIGLCIAMGIVESKRGFVPAFFALVGAVLVVEMAGPAYRSLFPGMSYCAGYATTVLIGFAIVAILTILLKRYAPTDIGAFDSPLAGIIGAFTGLVMAHALYGIVILGSPQGMNAAVYANSGLGAQIYELRGWHGFLDFMGRIGSSHVAEPSGR